MLSTYLGRVAVCAGSLLFATVGCATSFVTFDARSMAMGGVGVATGRPANAALLNPGLLAQTGTPHVTGQFLHLFVGARLIDRDDFLSRVEDFQDDYSEETLDDLLLSARTAFTDGALSARQLRNLADEGQGLLTAIEGLSDRPVRAAGAGGFSLGHVSQRWGAGIFLRQYTILGGRFELADIDVQRMQQLIELTYASADVIEFSEKLEGLSAAIGYPQIQALTEQSLAEGQLVPALLDYEDIPASSKPTTPPNPVCKRFWRTLISKGWPTPWPNKTKAHRWTNSA